MSCPFANVPFQESNEVTESQKVSYKIYDMEAEILKTTQRLEKLREARRLLEVEDEMKRLGTIENVEKEFNKIYGEGYRPNRQLTCLKPLLTSIVYTLKDFDNRLKGFEFKHNFSSSFVGSLQVSLLPNILYLYF